MDPLTVIGAVAASSQLLQQGANLTKFLWDLYSNMKNAPEDIRRQIVQIEQLLSLSKLFLQNASLQKDAVASLLGTCLLRAQEFRRMLFKVSVTDNDGKLVKMKKSFGAVMKKKEFMKSFENLEREKSALILCIQEIDSGLLGTIKISVEMIRDNLGDIQLVVKDASHNMKCIAQILPGLSDKITVIHKTLPDMALNLEKLALKLDQNGTAISLPPPEYSKEAKSYYLVPKRLVRGFIGREDVLTRIKIGFSSPGPRMVVIRGLGGQGKTQVALEYCRRAKNEGVRAIFWVDAISKISVEKSFDSIAEAIKPEGKSLTDGSRVRFVIEELEMWPEPWIMVFDNHDHPYAFNLQDFIPDGENPENAIELQGLPEKDALKLLLQQSRKQNTISDLQYGTLVIKRLGCHTLAITQAGSYIRLRKIELGQFLEHYNRQLNRIEILNQTPEMSQYRRKLHESAKEVALNVFTTWELSFQQLLEQDGPIFQRSRILTLFAFFDCKEISEELFKIYCNWNKPAKMSKNFIKNLMANFTDNQNVWNHDIFVGVLVSLVQMSLVESWSRDDEGGCHLTLHPLIKDWVRLRSTISEFKDYSVAAANILASQVQALYSVVENKYDDGLLLRQEILSHLDAHKENIDFLRSELNTDAFQVLYGNFQDAESWFMDYLRDSSRLTNTEEVERRVTTWRENDFGLEDTRTLDALTTYASNLAEQGRQEEAEKIDRQVFQKREEIFGPEHPSTLISLSNLALDLCEQRKYEEADRLGRLALERKEKSLGPEHPDTILSLSNLAFGLLEQGKCQEAEKINRHALQLNEKILGLEHRATLRSLNNLGLSLRKQGKLEEAEGILSRGLLLHESKFGPEHLNTLHSVWSFGVLCEDQGKQGEALACYHRACIGYKRILGSGYRKILKRKDKYTPLMDKADQLGDDNLESLDLTLLDIP